MLPELGVGVIYSQGLEPLVHEYASLIDVIEVEPQTLWLPQDREDVPYRINREAMDQVRRLPQPKLVHGVGFPIGSCREPDPRHVDVLRESVNILEAQWMSEHLSFNSGLERNAVYNAGFLLPPRQTREGASAAACTIRNLAAQMPVPLAFETGVNYLKPRQDELSEGRFFRAVAEDAACGILLDLHNLFCNERNGRQRIHDALDQMPLDRVWELHLAGGRWIGDYWIDAHSGVCPAELLGLAAEVVPRLPNLKAIIFEILPEFTADLEREAFRRQLEAMHRLWNSRHREPLPRPAVHAHENAMNLQPDMITAPVWEDSLAALVQERPCGGDLVDELARDPGIEIYREMMKSARAGMVVDILRFSVRYMLLAKGAGFFQSMLDDFWRERTPELFAAHEAVAFADFLKRKQVALPHLEEILDYELALVRVKTEAVSQSVRFSCEPMPLLEALGKGMRPKNLEPGNYELEITPEPTAAPVA